MTLLRLNFQASSRIHSSPFGRTQKKKTKTHGAARKKIVTNKTIVIRMPIQIEKKGKKKENQKEKKGKKREKKGKKKEKKGKKKRKKKHLQLNGIKDE